MPDNPKLTVEFNIDATPYLKAAPPEWLPMTCSGCGRTVEVHRDVLATYGFDRCIDCRPEAPGPNPYVRSAS